MISVIVPVYNVENYIKECMDSIICQKNIEFEIICINDGTKDRSLEILKPYEEQYDNVYIIEQENQGLSAARNAGLKLAKGDFVYFLDSDDYLLHDHVLSYIEEQMLQYTLDVLYMDALTVFETEKLEKEQPQFLNYYVRDKEYGEYSRGVELLGDFIRADKVRGQIALHCFKRQFLIDNGIVFPKGCLYEDNLFNFKVALLAGRVMHRKYNAFYYRVRSGSIMRTNEVYHNLWSLFIIYKEMMSFWQQHIDNDFYSEIYQMINSRIKRAARGIYSRMPEEEREKINLLAEEDRYILKNYILKEAWHDKYAFDYSVIKPKSKVVVYGAGKIGTHITNMLLQDCYVKVAGVIDKNASNMLRYDFAVGNIDLLEKIEYEYILIAIKNYNEAVSIKESLYEKGLDKKKIIICGRLYSKKEVFEKQYLYRIFVEENIKKDVKKLFLFIPFEVEEENRFIFNAKLETWLKENYNGYMGIYVTISEWKMLNDIIMNMIAKDDVVAIIKGFSDDQTPYITTVYTEIKTYFPQNEIVFVPAFY